MIKKTSFLFLLAFLFFLLDRSIKQIIIHGTMPSSDGFFYFFPYLNTQGPFSLPLSNFILLIITAVILFWLISFCYKAWLKNEMNIFWGSSLMIMGGFSNLWDRIIYGGVIDIWYINLKLGGLNFNLADVYLLIGLLIILKEYYRRRKFQQTIKINNLI